MIYLDYQATTPLAPEARAAMLPWLERFGNPHSPHRLGREAAAAVEVARDQVLAALVADAVPGVPLRPEEVALQPDGTCPDAAAPADPPPAGQLVFTSGATEALNWAIKGSWARRAPGRNRIVTIATEHAAVLESCVATGAEVVVLPVDRSGRVDPAGARSAIDERTALVAAMLVNNEIGVISPVAAIGAMARAAGAIMLCDAVQGYGRIRVPVAACDMIALSAHKIHGPKGIGALWIRAGCEPAPLLHGGGQEHGIRSGTLSPMLCAGFGAAAAVAQARKGVDMAHVATLFERLRTALGPGWHVNGDRNARWHGNLNVRRQGVDAARLISELRGIAFSVGSACASGSGRPSHVLKAIGLTDGEARGSIRLGFGRYTTTAEIDEAAATIARAATAQLEYA